MTAILGISAYYHDSAACLVIDGDIVAAAQEERFSRTKHDHSFPTYAIGYCLEETGLRPDQLDYVGFYDKPLVKFERLLETYLDYAPVGFPSFLKAMPLWMKEKLWLPDLIRRQFAELEGFDVPKEVKRRASTRGSCVSATTTSRTRLRPSTRRRSSRRPSSRSTASASGRPVL